MLRFVCIRNKTPKGWAIKDRHDGELEYYPTRDQAKAARNQLNQIHAEFRARAEAFAQVVQ